MMKVNLIDNEIPVYKKKSKKKGQSRADHKHIYETVLLTRYFHFNLDKPRTSEQIQPTKVCTICGRIDYVDQDESLYDMRPDDTHTWAWTKALSKKALSLPQWYADSFDKFATKMEDEDDCD